MKRITAILLAFALLFVCASCLSPEKTEEPGETTGTGEPERALQAGMIVSDEPGVYIEGSHGIRIENILEVVTDVANSDGQFLRFEHLTYVPLDPDGIDVKYMQPIDVDRLNAYNREVRKRILPLIEEKEIREWVEEQTQEILWSCQ